MSDAFRAAVSCGAMVMMWACVAVATVRLIEGDSFDGVVAAALGYLLLCARVLLEEPR